MPRSLSASRSHPPPSANDLVDLAEALLDEEEWHSPDHCAECDEAHCTHSGDAVELSEAVRMLHSQAHTEPTDTFTAERCHREPCRSVSLIEPAHDTLALFTPGSRVSA